jgi:hypothetical protein
MSCEGMCAASPQVAWAGVWQCGARGQEARRGVTVPSPPLLSSREWRRGYPARVAAGGAWAELRDIDDALAAADRFVGVVLDGRVQAGTWGPLLADSGKQKRPGSAEMRPSVT